MCRTGVAMGFRDAGALVVRECWETTTSTCPMPHAACTTGKSRLVYLACIDLMASSREDFIRLPFSSTSTSPTTAARAFTAYL